MYLHWELVTLVASIYVNLAFSEMRTLCFESVLPPGPGKKFDKGLWLKLALMKEKDRCRCPQRNDNIAPCSCPVRLGLEDGTIPDSSITASSSYTEKDTCTPADGRLNKPDVDETTVGAWAPAVEDTNQWIQVDLGKATYVFGVLMQGRDISYDGKNQRVTKYMVQYETFPSQNHLAYVRDEVSEPQVFDGNTDDHDIVESLFARPIVATKVRIVPVEWHRYIAVRFELLGCK